MKSPGAGDVGEQAGPRARTLGVDIGTVRVGLAVSDPGGLVATPLGTLDVAEGHGSRTRPQPPGDADAWARRLAVRLAKIAADHACDAVVIGLPKALSGGDTPGTVLTRKVVDALRAEGLTVNLWDERLSSAEAERVLLDAGRSRAQRRESRDRVAATIILQGWLDARPR